MIPQFSMLPEADTVIKRRDGSPHCEPPTALALRNSFEVPVIVVLCFCKAVRNTHKRYNVKGYLRKKVYDSVTVSIPFILRSLSISGSK